MKKRLLSMALVLCMCLTLLPAAVFAEETDSPDLTADIVYHAGKYGKFTGDANTFPIPGGLKVGETYTLKTGEDLGISTEKGAIFAGWTLNQDAQNMVYWSNMSLPECITQVKAESTDPVTVYAVWDHDMNRDGIADRYQSCQVHFDMNSAVFSNSIAETDLLILPGYKFSLYFGPHSLDISKAIGTGWSLTPCDKLLTVQDPLPDDMVSLIEYEVTSDITFYAVWSANQDNNDIPDVLQKILIHYETNGAQNVPEDTNATWIRQGDKAPYTYTPLPISDQIPTKEGLVFQGWENKYWGIKLEPGVKSLVMDDEKYFFSNNNTLNLQAVWERIPGYKIPYSVTFAAEGLAPDKVPSPLKMSIDADSYTFTLPVKAPEREDAEFICWSYRDNGNRVALYPGDEIALRYDNSNVTLHAEWEVLDTRTVEFVAPDAKDGTVPQKMTIHPNAEGKFTFTVPETPVPLRDGYRFLGYKLISIEESPSTNPRLLTPLYQPGNEITLSDAHSYQLVAQWEKLEIPDPEIPEHPDPENPEHPDPENPEHPDPENPEHPDPETPETPNPENPETPDPENPQTGDNSSLMLWTLLCAASLCGVASVLTLNNKKKHTTR